MQPRAAALLDVLQVGAQQARAHLLPPERGVHADLVAQEPAPWKSAGCVTSTMLFYKSLEILLRADNFPLCPGYSGGLRIPGIRAVAVYASPRSTRL